MRAKAVLLALPLVVVGLALVLLFTHERSAEAISPGQAAVAPARARQEIAPLAPETAESRDIVAAEVEASPANEETPLATKRAPLAPDETRLLVRVVSKEKHEPLADIRLYLRLDQAADFWEATDIESASARAAEAPRTDPDGRADFTVHASEQAELHVLTDGQSAGRREIDVGRLAGGEERELVVELPTEDDIAFVGKICARENGQPIANARVELCKAETVFFENRGVDRSTTRLEKFTDERGMFELRASSWRQEFLRASAPGYSRIHFGASAGHETEETAFVVLLSRGATLRAHVSDASGAPVSDVDLAVSTEGYRMIQRDDGPSRWYGGDVEWRSPASRDGVSVIEDLPAKVPLRVTLESGGRAVRREAAPVLLETGEFRDLEIRLGAGILVRGTVLDQDDAPVSGQDLWLVAGPVAGARFLNSWQQREVVARTRTNADGRFVFEDIEPKRYRLAPAPRDWDDAADDGSAAYAQEVTVLPEPQEQEFVLRVHRGLFVRGHVVDPKGAVVSDAWVQARALDDGGYLGCSSGEDGAFTVGPLVPGRYRLSSGGFGNAGSFAGSDPVDVEAGDEGVRIVVREGAALTGRVVDESGAAQEAELFLRGIDAVREDYDNLSWGTDDGRFEMQGLDPGTYELSATTKSGAIAVARVELKAGEKPTTLVLELHPGAKLELDYKGSQDWVTVELSNAASFKKSEYCQRGEVTTVVVPAGKLTVETLSDSPGAGERRELEAAAGATVKVPLRKP